MNLRHQLTSAKPECTDLPQESEELSKTALKERYNSAVKTYKQVRGKAANLRHQLLKDLLAKYKHDDDPKTKEASAEKARIVWRTIQGEQCREMFKTIGNAVKPKNFGGVQRLLMARHKDATQPSGTPTKLLRTCKEEDIVWGHVISREDIEHCLLQFN